MLKSIKAIAAILVMVAGTELIEINDVIYDYTTRELWFEGKLIIPSHVLLITGFDMNNDGIPDIMVTCPEMYYHRRYTDLLAWDIYLGSSGGFNLHTESPVFSPEDLVLVKDEVDELRLARVRWYPEGRGVMPLELDARGAMSTEGIRFIDDSSVEDMEWLEEGRKAAQGLIRTYTQEDIAALKAKRNVGAATQVSPPSPLPPVSDTAATSVPETVPQDHAITDMVPQHDALTVEKEVEFIEGEARDGYSADTRLSLLVFGIALLFCVGLSALFLYRRKQ